VSDDIRTRASASGQKDQGEEEGDSSKMGAEAAGPRQTSEWRRKERRGVSDGDDLQSRQDVVRQVTWPKNSIQNKSSPSRSVESGIRFGEKFSLIREFTKATAFNKTDL